MMNVRSCVCGGCPVLVEILNAETGERKYKAVCYSQGCKRYGKFTVTDSDYEFVMEQWNTLVELELGVLNGQQLRQPTEPTGRRNLPSDFDQFGFS